MHLTFEEFYAARELVARYPLAASRIRRVLHNPRWEEPILLALGYTGAVSPENAEGLVESAILARGDEASGLEPSFDEEVLHRDFLFALRCLGDLVPVAPKTRRELLDKLFDMAVMETDYTRSQRMDFRMACRLLPPRDQAYLFDLVDGVDDSDSLEVQDNAWLFASGIPQSADAMDVRLLAWWERFPVDHERGSSQTRLFFTSNADAISRLTTLVRGEMPLALHAATILSWIGVKTLDDITVRVLRDTLRETPTSLSRFPEFDGAYAPEMAPDVISAYLKVTQLGTAELTYRTAVSGTVRNLSVDARASVLEVAKETDNDRLASAILEGAAEPAVGQKDSEFDAAIVLSVVQDRLSRLEGAQIEARTDLLQRSAFLIEYGATLDDESADLARTMVSHSHEKVRLAALNLLDVAGEPYLDLAAFFGKPFGGPALDDLLEDPPANWTVYVAELIALVDASSSPPSAAVARLAQIASTDEAAASCVARNLDKFSSCDASTQARAMDALVLDGTPSPFRDAAMSFLGTAPITTFEAALLEMGSSSDLRTIRMLLESVNEAHRGEDVVRLLSVLLSPTGEEQRAQAVADALDYPGRVLWPSALAALEEEEEVPSSAFEEVFNRWLHELRVEEVSVRSMMWEGVPQRLAQFARRSAVAYTTVRGAYLAISSTKEPFVKDIVLSVLQSAAQPR